MNQLESMFQKQRQENHRAGSAWLNFYTHTTAFQDQLLGSFMEESMSAVQINHQKVFLNTLKKDLPMPPRKDDSPGFLDTLLLFFAPKPKVTENEDDAWVDSRLAQMKKIKQKQV